MVFHVSFFFLFQVAEYKGTFSLNSKLYVTMVSALLIPYVMIKSLKALAPFSAFANLLNSVGLVIILVNLFQEFPHYSARPAFGSLATLPLFFGQAIFSFEGIGLVRNCFLYMYVLLQRTIEDGHCS